MKTIMTITGLVLIYKGYITSNNSIFDAHIVSNIKCGFKVHDAHSFFQIYMNVAIKPEKLRNYMALATSL